MIKYHKAIRDKIPEIIEKDGYTCNVEALSDEKFLVEIEKKYFRPAEVELLLGDPSKAEKELNWKRLVSFQELVSGMVKYDLENDSFGGKE